jgi:hypothetical protein
LIAISVLHRTSALKKNAAILYVFRHRYQRAAGATKGSGNWGLVFFPFLYIHHIMSSVILVTGGSGLVGKAIEWVIENDKSERYGKKEGETWIFLTSKDGDLRQVF